MHFANLNLILAIIFNTLQDYIRNAASDVVLVAEQDDGSVAITIKIVYDVEIFTLFLKLS